MVPRACQSMSPKCEFRTSAACLSAASTLAPPERVSRRSDRGNGSVILGAPSGAREDDALDQIVRALFQSPHTCILLVSERGSIARLHELTPTHHSVADVTPDGIGAAILARLVPSSSPAE